MGYITVGRENTEDIALYYEDHGAGKPVVLIHGYPLNGRSWEKQEAVLLASGYRVITYDRRGFGQSSKPSVGYDYDTFAGDLNALMETLDLNDVALVGFSMGTGEVARYISRYGTDRVSKAGFLGPIPPYLLKQPDNPEGVDQSVFDGIKDAIRKDRYAQMTDFFNMFYNADKLKPERVSEQVIHANFEVAVQSSATAYLACVDTWLTDFRRDVPKITVPSLVLQGDADNVLPNPATGARLKDQLPNLANYVLIPGAPHGLLWTHADEVNRALLDFLGK